MDDDMDIVTIPPTLTGPGGKAWEIDKAATLKAAGIDPKRDATVMSHIVEASWAHPAWHSYWIAICHLRPMPDARETKIYLEGATHEIWVWALNPEASREKMITTGRPEVLSPINFAAQFVEPHDAAAMERGLKAVQAIIAGELSPDTDFRQMWIARFGGNMMKR